MKVALITLSKEGAAALRQVKRAMPEAKLFVSNVVDGEYEDAERFDKVVPVVVDSFDKYDGLVFAAPCGAVVRAIAGLVKSKKSDPAVLVLDVGARHVVSLLSGHEGGANDLAVKVSNALGAEPVITTTTEAVKNIIVGVGCRKGKSKNEILYAIKDALKVTGIDIDKVRYIASADVKKNETGLLEAAESLEIPARFIQSEEILASNREFSDSEFVKKSVGLPAVAEPAALLSGRRTKLILRKTKYNGITVAIAKENCSSLE